jgi:hypothetical protein
MQSGPARAFNQCRVDRPQKTSGVHSRRMAGRTRDSAGRYWWPPGRTRRAGSPGSRDRTVRPGHRFEHLARRRAVRVRHSDLRFVCCPGRQDEGQSPLGRIVVFDDPIQGLAQIVGCAGRKPESVGSASRWVSSACAVRRQRITSSARSSPSSMCIRTWTVGARSRIGTGSTSLDPTSECSCTGAD